MHFVGKVADAPPDPLPGYDGRCAGFSRAVLVGGHAGSVHMGLGLCRLEAGGRLDPHVHSYERASSCSRGRSNSPSTTAPT